MVCVCRALTWRVMSLVVSCIQPKPSGRPSSAANLELQSFNGMICALTKSSSVKIPAAPESNLALV